MDGAHQPDLLRAIGDARAATTAALQSDRLPEAVRAIGAELPGVGSQAIWGASIAGHALAGAVVLEFPNKAKLWVPGSREPVLLLDGVIASVSGLSISAHNARQIGATKIAAIVLGSIGGEATSAPSVEQLVDLGLNQPGGARLSAEAA